MATPFTGTLVMHAVGGNGGPRSKRFSANDVAAANVTYDDMGAIAFLTIPTEDAPGWMIDDLTLSAAGVSTTQLQVFKGAAGLEIILRDGLLANTTTDATSRCQGLKGTVLGSGATYFLRQLA
jgi:hypothetical protein